MVRPGIASANVYTAQPTLEHRDAYASDCDTRDGMWSMNIKFLVCGGVVAVPQWRFWGAAPTGVLLGCIARKQNARLEHPSVLQCDKLWTKLLISNHVKRGNFGTGGMFKASCGDREGVRTWALQK